MAKPPYDPSRPFDEKPPFDPSQPASDKPPFDPSQPTTFGGGVARVTVYNNHEDQYGSESARQNPLTGKRQSVEGVTIAVDPKLIPYGSRVKIPALAELSANKDGIFIAHDTGGAVKSRKASGGNEPVIDVYVAGQNSAEAKARMAALDSAIGQMSNGSGNLDFEILDPPPARKLDGDTGTGRIRSAFSTMAQTAEAGFGKAMEGLGTLGAQVVSAVQGTGTPEEAAAEERSLRQVIAKAKSAPDFAGKDARLADLEQRLATLGSSKEILGVPDAVRMAGRSIVADAEDRFTPNPKFAGEFFADTVPQVAGSAVQSVAPFLIPGVGPAAGVAQMFGQTYQDTYEKNRAKGVDEETAIRRGLLNGIVSGGLEPIGGGIVAGAMKKLATAKAAQGVGRAVIEGTAGEGLTGAMQETASQVISQEQLDPMEIAKQGALEALGGFMMTGAAAGVGRALRRGQPAPDATAPGQEQAATLADLSAGDTALTPEEAALFAAAAPVEAAAPVAAPDPVAAVAQDPTDLSAPTDPTDLPSDPAPAPAPQPVATPAPAPRKPTKAELAEAEYLRQQQEEYDAVLNENTVGLAEALRRIGGLPSRKSQHFGEWSGELGMLIEERQGARKRLGNKRLFENLFDDEARSMDTVAESLREEGFDVGGADDVFRLVDQWMRSGKEPRAELRNVSAAESMVGMDIPFSKGAVTPAPPVAPPVMARAKAAVKTLFHTSAFQPDVMWHNSPANIAPEFGGDRIRSEQARGYAVEGYYLGGRVHLVADGIAQGAARLGVPFETRAQQVALHEAVGEAGVGSVLASKHRRAFNSIVDGVYSRMTKEEIRQIAKDYGYNVATPAGRADVVQEHLARQTENGIPKQGRIARAIAQIRELLRTVFPKLRMTDGDIVALLNAARNRVQAGPTAAESVRSKPEEIRFSKVPTQEQTEAAAASPEKRRAHVDTVRRMLDVHPDVKSNVESFYRQVTAEEVNARAAQTIDTMNVGPALTKFMASTATDEDTLALGHHLAQRLQAMDRIDEATMVRQKMAESLTSPARALWYISTIAKTSPEGIRRYAEKLTEQGAADMGPELAAAYKNIEALKRELAAVKRKLASETVLEVQKDLTPLKVTQEQAEKAVQAEKDAANANVQALQAELDKVNAKLRERAALKDLTPELAAAQSAAAGLQAELDRIKAEIQTSKQSGVDLAQQLADAHAKMKAMAEELEKVKRKLGLKSILVIQDYLNSLKLTPERLTELNTKLRDALVLSPENPGTARNKIVGMLVNFGMENKQATKLAEVAIRQFTAKAKKVREGLIKKMLAGVKAPKERVPKTVLEKLMLLNNEGKLTDDTLHAEIAKALGVPVFTREAADRIARLQKEYEAAPDGPVKMVKGAQMLEAVHELVPTQFWSKVRAIQNISMLFSGKTILRNIVGNVGMFALNGVTDTVNAFVVDWTTSLFTGQRSSASPALWARIKGLSEPIRVGKAGWQWAADQGLPVGQRLSEALRTVIDTGRMLSAQVTDPKQLTQQFKHTFSSRVGRLLEDGLGLALGSADLAFWGSAYQASLARQMATAKANGVEQLAPTQEMQEQALYEAQRAIFQDPNMASAALKGLQKLLNLPRKDQNNLPRKDQKRGYVFDRQYGLGSATVPFSQVPGSILMQGLEYSPAGVFNTALEFYELYKSTKGTADRVVSQRQFTEALSRFLVGTGGGLLVGLWFTRLGIISGAPDEDKDVEAMRRTMGVGGYSFNYSEFKRRVLSGNWTSPAKLDQSAQEGDVLFGYDWFQPAALPAMMGAAVAQQMDKAERSAIAIAKSTADTVTRQPMMAGINQLMRDSTAYGLPEAVVRKVLQIPGNFVPAMVRQTEQYMNDAVAETRGGTVFEQEWNKIQSKIPFLGNRFPAKLDAFGQAVDRYHYGGNGFLNTWVNPFTIAEVKRNPAANEMMRLYETTGKKDVVAPIQNPNVKVNGQPLQLTNEQIVQMQNYTGKLAAETMTRLMASPQFVALPDEYKAVKVAQFLGDIQGAAKIEILGQNPVNVNKFTGTVSRPDDGTLFMVLLGRARGLAPQR